ncbi:MAG: hypothetical protein KDD53_11065 [Bdellovibrionales bacterium]|nr:hypothetical protein [Bdellovibrionales bacterium]
MQGKSGKRKLSDPVEQEVAIGRELSPEEKALHEFQAAIKENWDKPDELTMLIERGLDFGLAAEVLSAAEHLAKIDPNRERGVFILAVVQLNLEKVNAAQITLATYLRDNSETERLAVLRASISVMRNQSEDAIRTLWKVLQGNPNSHEALSGIVSIALEHGEKEASIKALQRASLIKESWLPQLWLIKEYILSDNFEECKPLLEQIAPKFEELPDILIAISGELGRLGKRDEMIELLLPLYNVEKHAPLAGFNLLKALIQAQKVGPAEKLLREVSRVHGQTSQEIANVLATYARHIEELKTALDPSRSSPLTADGKVKEIKSSFATSAIKFEAKAQ